MVTDVRVEQTLDGDWIAFKVPKSTASDLLSTSTSYISKGKKFSLKLKLERRSNDANAYMWVLLGELSKVLNLSSEEIYKNIIRDFGAFEIIPIKEDKIEHWYEIWLSKGIGWICEDLGECKNTKGYHNIKSFYGSSTYDTKEMSRLIDAVVEECKLQDIETMTPAELSVLKENWR